jgi:aldose 1-epimerase
MPPHAIHGTTLRRSWTVTEATAREATLEVDLAPDWPFGGRAVQRVQLGSASLRSTLEVHAADRPMPVIVGWHPWFPRRLARGGDLQLAFDPAGMLVRGPDGIPTGEVVAPHPGPWDDAFVGVETPPRIRWPGALEVELRADVPVWVLYTEQPGAIAIEPQTGPPNGLATGDHAVVEPGSPLVASLTLAWRRLAD